MSKARVRCPTCDAVAVRLETKAAGTGGKSRTQAAQPRGGELPPGLLYLCRRHGAFTTGTDNSSPETKAMRRLRLAAALREVTEELGGRT